MANEEDAVQKQQIVDARARNISHNVRCTECGSQSIEDSQADIAVLLRKVDPIFSHLNKHYICCNKEIFKLILPIAILLFQIVASCYAIASLSLIQYIYPHDPAGCIS